LVHGIKSLLWWFQRTTILAAERAALAPLPSQHLHYRHSTAGLQCAECEKTSVFTARFCRKRPLFDSRQKNTGFGEKNEEFYVEMQK
jgi:hypothetical protein